MGFWVRFVCTCDGALVGSVLGVSFLAPFNSFGVLFTSQVLILSTSEVLVIRSSLISRIWGLSVGMFRRLGGGGLTLC